MRPDRFEGFAVELAKGAARTLKEAGDEAHPYGLAAMLDGREVRFQFVAQRAPGENYQEPEQPVEGDPVDPDALAPVAGTGAERWLAGLLATSGSRELTGLEVWSPREGNRPGHAGVTARFHNGSRVFARIL